MIVECIEIYLRKYCLYKKNLSITSLLPSYYLFTDLPKSSVHRPMTPTSHERRLTMPRSEKSLAIKHLSGPHHAYVASAAQEEAFTYLCGAVIGEFLRAHDDCEECRNILCEESRQHSFTQMRKFDATSNLHYPTKECLDFFRQLDTILHRHLLPNIHKLLIKKTMMRIVQSEVTGSLPSCHKHTPELQNFVSEKWIEKSIKIYCRDTVQKIFNKRRECRKRKKLMKSFIPSKKPTVN